MDGGAWKAAVHGVAEDRTQLSDFTFTFHFHALEKEMATHSSILAWRVPGTEEPGRLQSMGSQRVGQDHLGGHKSERLGGLDSNFTTRTETGLGLLLSLRPTPTLFFFFSWQPFCFNRT